jgi:hypothetical protein
MNEWVYYRGGPKDTHVLAGKDEHDGFLLFDGPGAAAYYRLTAETVTTHNGVVPVAEYVGSHPTKS